MDVAANAIVQRAVSPDLLGRVFGTLYGAIGVAAALSSILGGLLLDAISPRTRLPHSRHGRPAHHSGNRGSAPAPGSTPATRPDSRWLELVEQAGDEVDGARHYDDAEQV
jgi:hypothetical protein